MFWAKPKRGPVFCVNCRWHRLEGVRHLCHHPSHVLAYTDYVTGEPKVIAVLCGFENRKGECREYEPQQEG